MTERDLELTLRDLAEVHVRQEAPADVREDARLVPLSEAPPHSWMPRPEVRFQSMFSATKFVVAGAIVVLFGGLLLIAQPLDQQGGSVPGAATDSAAQGEDAISAVSGGWSEANYWEPAPGLWASPPPDGTSAAQRGPEGTCGRMEMSDVRLNGDVSCDWSFDAFGSGPGGGPPDPEAVLWWGTLLIENDGGTWEGTHYATEPWEASGVLVLRLVGSGDYEGLSAILHCAWEPDVPSSCPEEEALDGLIFPGDLPPDRE